MTEVVRSRSIARPVADVWAVLADFGALSTWAEAVDHSSLLGEPDPADQPDGQADHVGLVRRVQLGRITLLEEVVRWEEPSALAYRVTGLPKVVRSLVNSWTLEPEGDHATTVTLTSSLDCGPRPPQQLVARLVGRKVGTQSTGLLAGLADHLEGTDA